MFLKLFNYGTLTKWFKIQCIYKYKYIIPVLYIYIYIYIYYIYLHNYIYMAFTTEGFFEVARESWSEWDLNP